MKKILFLLLLFCLGMVAAFFLLLKDEGEKEKTLGVILQESLAKPSTSADLSFSLAYTLGRERLPINLSGRGRGENYFLRGRVANKMFVARKWTNRVKAKPRNVGPLLPPWLRNWQSDSSAILGQALWRGLGSKQGSEKRAIDIFRFRRDVFAPLFQISYPRHKKSEIRFQNNLPIFLSSLYQSGDDRQEIKIFIRWRQS